MNANDVPPKYYGNLDDLDKARATFITAGIASDLFDFKPEVAINIGVMLIVSAMQRIQPPKPDELVADVGDCIVHSYSNLKVYCDTLDALFNAKGK
jgi:hypothetical protein